MSKGEWQKVRAAGLERMKAELRQTGSLFVPFADALIDFKPFVLLQARVHYIQNWARDGCLLVGDAAHCASPVGAVGVSLSVGTAIVAAEVILQSLASGDVSAEALGTVQRLREEDVKSVHNLQLKAERIMLSHNPIVLRLRPAVISLAAKTPLKKWAMQRFFIEANPLPISESLRVED
jgi:2-polyprenyl-6-methoxyphenol hydroxylase-like FAD-dependent oxidoreductase